MKILNWELKKIEHKPKRRANHKSVRYPTKENQLLRIAKLISHRSGIPVYGLMYLVPVVPDRTHIYYIYKTKYTGDEKWAKMISKHYHITIENLL